MFVRWERFILLISTFLLCLGAFAGGSGLNTVLVINQTSANSVELANYYMWKRAIPPENILRIHWPGGNVDWSLSDFQAYLANPLQAMIASRHLSNQLEHVVLSMDIPYRVGNGGGPLTSGLNSTTATLFYGFKPDADSPSHEVPSCNLPEVSSNSFAGVEQAFREVSNTGNSFLLATMLTSSNLAEGKILIDRAVASDATYPTQSVYLVKSSDPARNIRHLTFDNAVFNSRIIGQNLKRVGTQPAVLETNLFGYSTGVVNFQSHPGTFMPGAIADNLTSFSGRIFESTGQTPILEFLRGGASASYGTVVEPCAYLEKFPSPMIFFYQARGFNLGECTYMSVTNPHQGLLLGEPLAAPFARHGTGEWASGLSNATLTGTTRMAVDFTPAPGAPLSRVDLFIDGKFSRTLTNLPPAEGNLITVELPGRTVTFSVPADASIASVTRGLAEEINRPVHQQVTKVHASAVGDRIELYSKEPTRAGVAVSLSASTALGNAEKQSTYVVSPGSSFLETAAHAFRNVAVRNSPAPSDYLQLQITKTNGTVYTFSVTNNGALKLGAMLLNLANQVNNATGLQGQDGVVAEDFLNWTTNTAEFNVRARSPGLGSAFITVQLSGSATFLKSPSHQVELNQNASDLWPRQHLYVQSGNSGALPVNFDMDTSALADGYHELTAVAYEGTHVRTQTRATIPVVISNSAATGSLQLLSGTRTFSGLPIRIQVSGAPDPIRRVELFTTGGSVGSLSNSSSGLFELAASWLGPGRHPVWAEISSESGRYRTRTAWVEVLPALVLESSGLPLALKWQAQDGIAYEVLSGSSHLWITNLRARVLGTNGVAEWRESEPPGESGFYRVRTAE